MGLFKNVGIGSEHLKSEMEDWVQKHIFSQVALRWMCDLEWSEEDFCYWVSSKHLDNEHTMCKYIFEGNPKFDIPSFIRLKDNHLYMYPKSQIQIDTMLKSFSKDPLFFEKLHEQSPWLSYILIRTMTYDQIIFKRHTRKRKPIWEMEIRNNGRIL